MALRQRFGSKTRNERYRLLLSAAAGGGASDEHIANVALLAAMDGSDEDTTYTADVGGQTLTFIGNAKLDNVNPKFGTTSLLLDGTGDNVTIPDEAALEFGSAEFTVECHVRWSTDPTTTQEAFISKWGSAAKAFYFGLRNNQLVMFHSSNGSGAFATLAEAFNPVVDQWYHIAFVRDNSSGGVMRVFVDGTQLGTDNPNISSNPSINDNAELVLIGAFNDTGSDYFTGNIENVRVTLGVARYAANFTAPTEAYPTS